MTIDSILKDHTSLEIECFDRLYLTGYVPFLQTGGGLVNFFTKHRKKPIPSPALLNEMTQKFRRSVEQLILDLHALENELQKFEKKYNLPNEYPQIEFAK